MSSTMKFFSKVLDLRHTQAFLQYGLTADKLETKQEVEIYNYIEKHIKQNGEPPTPEEVAVKFDEFVYLPSNSSFDALAEEINDRYAKTELVRLIQGKAMQDDLQPKKEYLENTINEKPSMEVIAFLEKELQNLKAKVLLSDKVGLSITEDVDWFLDEYEKRSKGESFKVWASKFNSLNKTLGGGYAGGNMYVFYGRSGRGKSIFVLEEALAAAMQGATVLFWSLEMLSYEMYCRAYSSLSARLGVYNRKIDGIDYNAGFPQREMLMASLTEKFKLQLQSFIQSLNEIMPGKLIVRSVDDKRLLDKSVRALEADIIKTKADVVVVDAIYLMDMERNTSKVAGGDVAKTSKALRLLAGKLQTVMHVVTQAEETNEHEDEDGKRELQPPTRKELSKSKQILQDATLVIAIDTCDGRGIIAPKKVRSGGEGERIEVIFLPNYGIVSEMPGVEESKEAFPF